MGSVYLIVDRPFFLVFHKEMKTIQYEVNDDGIKGHLELKRLHQSAKFQALTKLGFIQKDDGEIEPPKDNFEMGAQIILFIEPHVISCDLTREDGSKILLEDLFYEGDTVKLLTKAAMFLLKGSNPGPKLKTL